MSSRDEMLSRIRRANAAAGQPGGPPPPASSSGPAAGQPGGSSQAASPGGQRSAAASGVPAAGQPGGPPPATSSGGSAAYRTVGDKSHAELLDLLAGRLTDYRAAVRRCPPCDLGLEVAAALTARGVRRVVIPAGLAGLPGLARLARDLPGVELVTDDPSAADPSAADPSGAAPLDAAGLDACDGAVTGAAVAVAETGTIVLDASPDQGRRAISLIPDYHLCIVGADQVVELVPEAIAFLAADAGERPLTWISGPSATSDIELERVEGVHGPRTLEVIIVEPG